MAPAPDVQERREKHGKQQQVLRRAAGKEAVRRAVEDYQAIKLKRLHEAAQAKEHITQVLCHPLTLRPESNWRPFILPKSPQIFFKVVAAHKGKLLSVYDGKTEYTLSKWTVAKHGAASWVPIYACFYVYQDPLEAITAKFPEDSALANAPKMLIKVEARGEAYSHPDRRALAVSQVKPLELVTQFSGATLDVHYALNPVRQPDEAPLPHAPSTRGAQSARGSITPGGVTPGGEGGGSVHASSIGRGAVGYRPQGGSYSPRASLSQSPLHSDLSYRGTSRSRSPSAAASPGRGSVHGSPRRSASPPAAVPPPPAVAAAARERAAQILAGKGAQGEWPVDWATHTSSLADAAAVGGAGGRGSSQQQPPLSGLDWMLSWHGSSGQQQQQGPPSTQPQGPPVWTGPMVPERMLGRDPGGAQLEDDAVGTSVSGQGGSRGHSSSVPKPPFNPAAGSSPPRQLSPGAQARLDGLRAAAAQERLASSRGLFSYLNAAASAADVSNTGQPDAGSGLLPGTEAATAMERLRLSGGGGTGSLDVLKDWDQVYRVAAEYLESTYHQGLTSSKHGPGPGAVAGSRPPPVQSTAAAGGTRVVVQVAPPRQ